MSAHIEPYAGSGHALPSADRLRAILQAGIRAPSAENRHWLRFEVGDTGVDLVATDTAVWAEQPHRRWLDLLAHGAVVENMSLRAATCALAQRTHWFPQAERPDLVARCRWIPSGVPLDPLADAIVKRHTNRRFYRRQPVDAAPRLAMADAVAVIPGARLQWLDDAPLRAAALHAIRIAETERFRRPALHAELFAAVRFELGWSASTEEGLPPGALEVEPPMRLPFAALRRWSLMRAASAAGVHHVLGLRAAWLPCRLAPHLALVCCDVDDESLRAVHAGRALQRAWLCATAAGLAFQPMAAATALVRQQAGSAWSSAATQSRLQGCLDQLTGGQAGHAEMLFRIGHAQPPTVVTSRPSLERFMAPPSGLQKP